MTKIIRVGLSVSLMLMATVVLGQKVQTESAPGVGWSGYHTYSWGEGTPAKNPTIAQTIVAGIESRLAAKGFTKVEKDGDLVVIYHAAAETSQSINASSYGDYVGWDNRAGWGSPGAKGVGTAYIETVTVGHLIVQIADPKTKKFLWRSEANDTITLDQKKVTKMVDKSLNKMFGKFPPK
jgi:hypothetical protein